MANTWHYKNKICECKKSNLEAKITNLFKENFNTQSKNKKCKQKTFGLGKVTWSTCRESVKDKSLASREILPTRIISRWCLTFLDGQTNEEKEWVKRLDSFFLFSPLLK